MDLCWFPVLQQSSLNLILVSSFILCEETAVPSGPIPTAGRDTGRLSRHLSFHTFPPSTCRKCNCNLLFFFNKDGIYLKGLGSNTTFANVQHTHSHMTHCLRLPCAGWKGPFPLYFLLNLLNQTLTNLCVLSPL